MRRRYDGGAGCTQGPVPGWERARKTAPKGLIQSAAGPHHRGRPVLEQLAEANATEVHLDRRGRVFAASGPKISIGTRLVDETFPDVDSVLSGTPVYRTEVPASACRGALARLASVSEDKRPLVVSVAGDELRLEVDSINLSAGDDRGVGDAGMGWSGPVEPLFLHSRLRSGTDRRGDDRRGDDRRGDDGAGDDGERHRFELGIRVQSEAVLVRQQTGEAGRGDGQFTQRLGGRDRGETEKLLSAVSFCTSNAVPVTKPPLASLKEITTLPSLRPSPPTMRAESAHAPLLALTVKTARRRRSWRTGRLWGAPRRHWPHRNRRGGRWLRQIRWTGRSAASCWAQPVWWSRRPEPATSPW